MKINRFGHVIITPTAIKVEGFLIEREPLDPTDATEEQLLLGFAIKWAQDRMAAELKKAVFDVFRRLAIQKKAGAKPGASN